MPHVQQLLIERDNLAPLVCNFHRLLTHGKTTITRLAEPAVNLIILPFKIRNKSSVGLQVNRQILLCHGLYQGVLHKVGIQLRIQKNILDASWNILIMRTLHQGITCVFGIASITENNILEHGTGFDSCGDSHILVDAFPNPNPVAQHLLVLCNQPFPLIRCINKPPRSSSLIATDKDCICAILTHHFIKYIRVRLAEIEFIKRFLPLLNAQTMLVGIVEKQERSQHGAFTHALRPRKVHIPVYSNLCIEDIRAIYKNDFIQVLHLRLQFE